MPKSLNSNLNFIWDFQKLFFWFEFYLWKNVHVVGLIPLRILIYVCMSYIKKYYSFLLVSFLSALFKKRKEPPSWLANRPSQPPRAAQQRATAAPAPESPRFGYPTELPSSSLTTRRPQLISFPSPTLCRARARSTPPSRPDSTGSRSRVAPCSKLMSYKFLRPSSSESP